MTTLTTGPVDLKDLARLTPGSRDRYVDFLRALSIAVVVAGHYLGAVLSFEGGRVVGRSLLQDHPGLWPVTWIFQVMPLFFFAGGFSNLVSLDSSRRNQTSFLRTRAARLLRPAGVFLAVWLGVQLLLHATGIGGDGLVRVSLLPFGPLWFLAVYLVVVALTPVTVALHRRYRWGVVAGLALSAAAVDVVGLWGGHGALRFANFAFVWLLAHQLGYFYADKTLRRPALMAAGGLAAMVALTSAGYPLSMVGVDGEPVSNMAPPTICIVALTFWITGVAMLLRTPVTRWLQRPRAWMAVIGANRYAMTVYLWHLTALVIAAAALRPLGLGGPARLAAAGVVLLGLVRAFARFDRIAQSPVEPSISSRRMSACPL